MTYAEKLKHPKWQKKRIKILKRDNYKCTVCKSTKKLKVHHTFYYDKFIDPWLYPNKSLLTLCGKCHLEYHKHIEVEIKPHPKKKRESLAKIQTIQGLRVKKKNGDIIIIPY